jgi:uncharacterized protein YdiU (UPF0061 family)
MGDGGSGTLAFDTTFVRALPDLCEPWRAANAPAPRLLACNDALARELGVDPAVLRSPAGVDTLVGNVVPEGAEPVAMAYAGHQFGGWSPRLGDGRALLVGEVVAPDGRRVDLHLKGSGRTPFARGGDGKAAVGPMLREYVVGEAMHALGIPTTRALAVIATGEEVARETRLPGAVLARIAASHLRVGTFEYAASRRDPDLVRRLVAYAIERHHPAAARAAVPAVALFDAVVSAQARLVARWMSVGFVHGVMNTDNMTISGETIDYGPCAFMDAYDPATVFSSIDHGGRYAYGNQPAIAQWNLARLGETLLALMDPDTDTAVEIATGILRTFPDRYRSAFHELMRAKLGLTDERPGDVALVDDWLALLAAQRADMTGSFRSLAAVLRGEVEAAQGRFGDPTGFDAWTRRWQGRLAVDGRSPAGVAAAMDRVNPVYVPRNHLVEEALAAATAGDLAPFEQLIEVLARPFDERPGLERYAEPAPAALAAGYRTFCGT